MFLKTITYQQGGCLCLAQVDTLACACIMSILTAAHALGMAVSSILNQLVSMLLVISAIPSSTRLVWANEPDAVVPCCLEAQTAIASPVVIAPTSLQGVVVAGLRAKAMVESMIKLGVETPSCRPCTT